MKKKLLKELAYYETGGTCDELCFPTSVAELAGTIKRLSNSKTPFFYLGGGTNSLVMDEHWPGAVIVFSKLDQIRFNGETAYVEGGVENSVFAKAALAQKLAGAAWMYRLPGQIGGTVRMNARCYGGEISEIVTKVITVSKVGEIKEYKDPSVFRGYKDTIFMTNGDAIAAVEIKLSPGNPQDIEEKMKFCENDRVGKGQFLHPSCGCAFKNNYEVGVPSGMLLQAANVYDIPAEHLAINPQHANFVFNQGATSREILEHTLKMREKVYAEFGVWLDYEMEILGQLPEDLRRAIMQKKPQHFAEAALTPLRQRFQSKS